VEQGRKSIVRTKERKIQGRNHYVLAKESKGAPASSIEGSKIKKRRISMNWWGFHLS